MGCAILLGVMAGCGDDDDHGDFVPGWTAWNCSADDAGAVWLPDGGTLDAPALEDDAGASVRSCDPVASWSITLHKGDGAACTCAIGLDESFEVALKPCAGGHYASRMFVVTNDDERCKDLDSKGGARHEELVDVSSDGCTVHYRYARPWTNSSEEGVLYYDLMWSSDGDDNEASVRVQDTGFCHERLDLSATVTRVRKTQ